ncbi:MAG: lactate utilization protein B [Myxococcota bacterium]
MTAPGPGAADAGHPARARAFARDAARVTWHDAAVYGVRKRRDAAAASVPEWEALRDAAAALKAAVRADWGAHLEAFEARAVASGAHVHWAADARELCETVLGLLRARGARRVVKSKSMLTEECGLNPFLEAAGIEVVDTDLGERIVQLRREPPSHIVMPAIHLRREEVGELFHRALGGPAGERDPERLVALARAHLRDAFLGADAGITGANFAVAETGEIVVCTNEGNADLGTALPPLHIACVGIEKLVERERDLGVFLRLLARSATGQALTVYTSHFRGPAPGGELHVVLVDDGRSALAARPELASALSCIRCGACLNTCPVYRRSGGHSYATPVPGPIGSVLGPARDARAHASLPGACSLCGSCADVCPVKIDLPSQLLVLRAEIAQARSAPSAKRLGARAGAWMLARPRLLDWLRRAARPLVARLPRALVGRDAWTRHRALPDLPRASFRSWWQRERGTGARAERTGDGRGRRP